MLITSELWLDRHIFNESEMARSSLSARRSVVEMYLTPPALSETPVL